MPRMTLHTPPGVNRRRQHDDFANLLETLEASLSVTALAGAFYLVLRLLNRQFHGLSTSEVFVLFFLTGILTVHSLHYVVTAYLRAKRVKLENDADGQGAQAIYDQQGFLEVLRREMRRGGRYHLPMTLCYISLDNFNAILNQHGSAYGDKLLQKFAEVIIGIIRSSDYLSHFGHDQFSILLCHTDLPRAESFLLRTLLQTQERLEMSFSAGLTAYRTGEQAEDFLKRSQQALNQARQEGQKKTHCAIGKDDSQVIKSF